MYARPVGEAGQAAGGLDMAAQILRLIAVQHGHQLLPGDGGGGVKVLSRHTVQQAVAGGPVYRLGAADGPALAGQRVQGLGHEGVGHRLGRGERLGRGLALPLPPAGEKRMPGVFLPGVSGIPAVGLFLGDMGHQLVRLAQGAGVAAIVDGDLGAPGTVVVNPFGVRRLEPDAAQGSRGPQAVILLRHQGGGVFFGIAYRVKQDVPLDLGGVLAVGIVDHMQPGPPPADGEGAGGGGVALAPGGAHHGLDGDGIIALLVQLVDGDGALGPVDHDVVRLAAACHGSAGPGRADARAQQRHGAQRQKEAEDSFQRDTSCNILCIIKWLSRGKPFHYT